MGDASNCVRQPRRAGVGQETSRSLCDAPGHAVHSLLHLRLQSRSHPQLSHQSSLHSQGPEDSRREEDHPKIGEDSESLDQARRVLPTRVGPGKTRKQHVKVIDPTRAPKRHPIAIGNPLYVPTARLKHHFVAEVHHLGDRCKVFRCICHREVHARRSI